ncbi:MAG: lycopene cyclase domain-containing protein [Cryomorphaceae bacterium]|nr:lycopene cyclase domain-containing protein [Cryomorphaceae bacterium]
MFAFLGPLALSFDKKVAYYKRVRHLIIPIVLVSGLFLIWDQWFTEKGVWGFTLVHTAGLYLGRLPLEEVLFFVIVPYNCMFIFEVIGAYFQPKNKALFNRVFFGVFLLLGLSLLMQQPTGWYTLSAVLLAMLLSVTLLIYNPSWLSQFVISFLVCLLPFLVVNGLLTGAATTLPVVWYNPAEFSGWRIITIPAEDLFYNFDLLVGFVVFFKLSSERLSLSK